MDWGLLIVGFFIASIVSVAGYCLYTGLDPRTSRRWYERIWRVVAALFLLYFVLIMTFGDS